MVNFAVKTYIIAYINVSIFMISVFALIYRCQLAVLFWSVSLTVFMLAVSLTDHIWSVSLTDLTWSVSLTDLICKINHKSEICLTKTPNIPFIVEIVLFYYSLCAFFDFFLLLSLGRYLCWWTIYLRE
jgi:hypothetical protein